MASATRSTRIFSPPLPIMPEAPAASALGFDRLVMLATGARRGSRR